ncbi:MAG: ArsR family transcriptional regulator [Thermoprotei archaeon]|nr:MAG: ArsR family transcriptional regulator [Desulfurococcales archaeon ex4484_217_2]RLG71557.1 MAG: ArsR family transcriptional regulator [Thermoprotei archaeon]
MIEQILSSRNRIRILKYLLVKETANISMISRELNIHYLNVKEHLDFLEKKGIVKRRKYGRVTIYSLNNSNPMVYSLKRFLEEIGEI